MVVPGSMPNMIFSDFKLQVNYYFMYFQTFMKVSKHKTTHYKVAALQLPARVHFVTHASC